MSFICSILPIHPFTGKPDQMTRILDDANEILYFTEEHGADNGIHARDSQGRYYSILEGIDYNDETTGLGKGSTCFQHQ